MTTNRELVTTGRLAGDALAGMVGTVAHIQRSIAERTFAAVGPAATPARAAYHGVTNSIYAVVRTVHALAPRLGATVGVIAGKGDERASWSDSARPGWLSALNGLRGDQMAERYPDLAGTMSFRDRVGQDLPMRRNALVAALPVAGDSIAVFVHGLCESDRSWWRRAEAHHGDQTSSYGSMLEADLGWTPLHLRYNTGLPVADNAQALDQLVTELVDAWPVPVTTIAFIGHSMGGLVVRKACHDADLAGHSWTNLVRHVVCLGTPHLGAPLARGVERIVPPLSRISVTQPLAKVLDDRSAGVRDLEHGLGTDADLPFLDHANWTFIGATVTRDRNHPAAHLLGDLLVRYHSATGKNREERTTFDLDDTAHIDDTVHIGGIDHFDLLNHPQVYAQIAHRLVVVARSQ
ncbi:MAG: hypothetical protein Q8K63_05905 [Acidimicrobiales bacterium]|nr:hypothetical protein [Acidimicrobiales bacterium]